MDLASGLFALGGVALAGLLSELRAYRDSKSTRSQNIFDLRRETYSRGIRQVETVASKCARWQRAGSEDKQVALEEFWNALTEAYLSLNEIRLISSGKQVAEAYKAVLTVYRSAVEQNSTVLPKPEVERDAVVDFFRSDLGTPSSAR